MRDDARTADHPALARFRLDDRVAIVTGASSGLGVAFADALASAGAHVVCAARRADRIAETAARVRRHGREALAVATDVTDPASCDALVDAAVERFGEVHVLVNNAGVTDAVAASRERAEEFQAVVEVNLMGAFWTAQAAARAMRSGGSIVNVSSIMALTPGPIPQAAYVASKAGLNGLTRSLAVQWTGRKNIRVNALAPGFCHTEMTEELVQDADRVEHIRSRTLMGRLAAPHEIADALLFLAGDASSYVTGVTLPVDGGWTAW